MDYKSTFFVPSYFKLGLAENTSANLNEISQFERAISPELAQVMKDMAYTYPSMDKRLIAYLPLMGLKADDEDVLKIAQTQQRAMEKKQRVRTDVGLAKRASQLGFLAMDSAFQNISRNFKSSVVAAQETDASVPGAVIGNTIAGLLPGEAWTEATRKATLGSEFNEKYNQTKEAYGDNEFRRAINEAGGLTNALTGQGKPLNLGVGILPNSIALEDTDVYTKQIKLGKTPTQAYEIAADVYGRPITEEYERDEYQFTYQTKTGERIPISPGRVVAAQFSQEGEISYALASTIIDGAFRLGADPINILLGYGSAVKTAGRQVVSAAEVAQYVDDAKFITRALRTVKPTKKGAQARKMTFGKTAEQILNSKWGDKFIEALTVNESVARLKDIPTFTKVDTRVLNLLAKIKNKESMKEVVTSLLKHGDLSELMIAPYSGTFVGQEIAAAATATPISKLPMRQSVVAELANQLAFKFSGKAVDIAPLRNSVGALLGMPKNDPFRGIVGIGSSLRNALPQKVKRLFDLSPSKFASINYIAETIENIDGVLIALGEDQIGRDFYISELLNAKNQDEIVKIVQKLNVRIKDKVIKDNPDLKEDEELLSNIVEFVNNEIAEKRKYLYDSDGLPLSFPGTKYKARPQRLDAEGNILESIDVAVPTAFSIGQFADNFVPLTDFQELAKSLASFRRLVGPSRSGLRKFISTTWGSKDYSLTEKILQQAKIPTTGLKTNLRTKNLSIAPKGWLEYLYSDYIMQRALKPLWMLRPALALRVPPEEAVRIAMYGGPSVFRHPLLLASLKARPFPRVVDKLNLDKSDPVFVQMLDNLGEQLFATRINADEINNVAELIGNVDMKKSLENLDYDQIQQIMKVLRLNTNASGQVGDSFLQYAIDGNNATDFAFDEIVGELKQLKRQSLYSFDKLENMQFGSVTSIDIMNNFIHPFWNPSKSPAGVVSVIPNKKYKQIFEIENKDEVGKLIRQYVNNPSIRMQLEKQGHGVSMSIVDNNLILDVSVKLGSREFNTFKELEPFIKNALAIAIKAHQPKIYLRKEAFDLIPEQHPLKKLGKILNLHTGDALRFVEIPVYGQPDLRIDNVNFDSPVIKEIMEYLFDSNFQAAKKIVSKKTGYAQAAPSGTFFNTTPQYINTMSEQSLLKVLKPQARGRNAAEDFYINVPKYENSNEINPKWWQGWIHEMLNRASDPLFVVVARDGAKKALEFFTETTQGKKYITDLIKRSDDPDARSVLKNKDQLFKYLKTAEWEIGRLQGNPTSKIMRDGAEITEQEARNMLRDANGGFNFPDYEVDLNMGATKVKEFIANGGFIDDDDWLELAQKNAVQASRTERYFGKFYDQIKKVFDEEIREFDLGPRTVAYNNNPNINKFGQLKEEAIQKWDDMLGSLYSLFLAKPSDYLNRDPMFRWSFYTLAEDLMPFMTPDVKKEFMVGAKTWIEGSDLYLNLLKKAKETSTENTIETLEQAETLLKYKAMEEVQNLLYASSERHVLSDVMASYIPFPEIFQEVLKTWGKLTLENPQKFNRTRIAIDRGKESSPWDTDNAFFTSDPVTGELLFNYVDVMNVMTFGMTAIPGAFGFAPLQSSLLGEDLRDEGVRVKPYGFLEGLNLISANGFSPGFGPIVTFPFKILTKIATVPKVINNFILGNFESPGGKINLIDELPSWMKGVFKAIPFTQEATEEINASYSRTVMDIFTMYYYAGKWTPEDEESIKLAMVEAEKAAAIHWLVRGAAQAAYPTPIQPRYQIEDKNGAWWTIQVLGQKYQQMLEANQFDYTITTLQFEEKFGINPIPLRQSASAKQGRFPVKKESYAFWQKLENKKLIERKPYTAIFLKPDRVDDEFSLPAFMEGAQTLTPSQYSRAVQQSLLQFELEKFKEDLKNDKSLSPTARDERFSARKTQLQEEYGVIAYGNLGDAVQMADKYQIILEFRDWENEPLLSASPEMKPLKLFLDAYDEAIDIVINGGELFLPGSDRAVVIPKGGIKGKVAATLEGRTGNIDVIREELDAYARRLAGEYEDTAWIDMYLSSFWKVLDNRRYFND